MSAYAGKIKLCALDWNLMLWNSIKFLPWVGENEYLKRSVMAQPYLYLTDFGQSTYQFFSLVIIVLYLVDLILTIRNPFQQR
jgi:hypothetical protein